MSKGLFTFIISYIFLSSVTAQETDVSRIYEVRSDIPVFACNIIGTRIDSANTGFDVPPLQSKFALVRYHGSDTMIIRFLNWEKVTSSTTNRKSEVSDSLNSKFVQRKITPDNQTESSAKTETVKIYFLISRQDLDSNCVKVYNTGLRKSAVFTFGFVTMPMKIRLRNFDFQGNISLGTTAGARVRLSRYNSNYINFLLGASIATITLDSFSTRGRVAGQPINNVAVFSPSLGAVFEFGKAQAGIFYGWDFLNKSNLDRYTWIYNKKPWISVGFGFTIFAINTTSSQATDGKNTVSSVK